MLSQIVMAVATALPKAVVEGIFAALARYSLQRALRRAAEDLVLDAIEDVLESDRFNLTQEEVQKIRKKNKRAVSKEVKARFDPIFKAIRR